MLFDDILCCDLCGSSSRPVGIPLAQSRQQVTTDGIPSQRLRGAVDVDESTTGSDGVVHQIWADITSAGCCSTWQSHDFGTLVRSVKDGTGKERWKERERGT